MDKELLIQKVKKGKEERVNRIIEWLQNMKPFTVDFTKTTIHGCLIPEPPVLNKDLYQRYVIPNYIRCGAIPKDKLVIGETYIGRCRNADEATWDGDYFVYQREKFGETYPEKIKHFMDDDYNGTDVFVPIAIKE